MQDVPTDSFKLKMMFRNGLLVEGRNSTEEERHHGMHLVVLRCTIQGEKGMGSVMSKKKATFKRFSTRISNLLLTTCNCQCALKTCKCWWGTGSGLFVGERCSTWRIHGIIAFQWTVHSATAMPKAY